MTIILFGTGCELCREIAANIESVIASLSEPITFEKTSDLGRMLSYGIHSTPSLVIDGEVVSVSKSLSTDDISELLSRKRGG